MTKILEHLGKIIHDEDASIKEDICVYEASSEDIEDFELLSHVEQLEFFNLKEEKTPNTTHGSVTRYYFDVSTSFIVVHQTTISW